MKPDFKDLKISLFSTAYGFGNKAICPVPVSIIILNEDQFDERQKETYYKKKEIYDKWVNKGQEFIPQGKSANKVVAKIIRVNPKTETVSWVQSNFEEGPNSLSKKIPAKGKWSINTIINLAMSGQIKFIDKL